MDNLTSCFTCSKTIPDKATYYFCSKCLTQLRCKGCNELLEKDDLGCSNCGTPILERKDDNSGKAVNTIEFEQKGNNKKFVANFTDYVGENLVSSLSGLFLGNAYKPTVNPFVQPKNSQLPSVSQGSKGDVPIEDAVVISSSGDELNNILINIFRADADKISLINSRVKHTGKRDQAIRITLLLLYAYSLTGKNQIKRNIVVDVLQNAAVYDNNYIGWLSRCDEIKKTEGDLLELNLPGRDAAIAILKEFSNPAIEKGSVHFSATSAKSGKSKSKKTKGDSASSDTAPSGKSTSSRMSPAKMIDILIAESYFNERKRIPEIIKYCKEIKGQGLDTSPLSTALLRKVKSGAIKREKNSSDSQYEYYQ